MSVCVRYDPKSVKTSFNWSPQSLFSSRPNSPTSWNPQLTIRTFKRWNLFQLIFFFPGWTYTVVFEIYLWESIFRSNFHTFSLNLGLSKNQCTSCGRIQVLINVSNGIILHRFLFRRATIFIDYHPLLFIILSYYCDKVRLEFHLKFRSCSGHFNTAPIRLEIWI